MSLRHRSPSPPSVAFVTSHLDHTPADTSFTLTRRTFVGSSMAVGGTVAAATLLPGCDSDTPNTAESATTTVRMRINGEERELEIDNRTSLLDMLRERADLPGTKKGCDQGACGACTVLVDGVRINSCLTLAVMHDGADVVTIEGLEHNGRLHPLQQAFIDHDGLQCGYCTPGQILSGIGCIREGHNRSRAEVAEWMSGNLCRCGAYSNIVDAVLSVREV